MGEHVLSELVLDGGNHGGLDVCLVDDEGINCRTNALFEDCPQKQDLWLVSCDFSLSNVSDQDEN